MANIHKISTFELKKKMNFLKPHKRALKLTKNKTKLVNKSEGVAEKSNIDLIGFYSGL